MCLGKNLYKYIRLFDAIEYSHFYTRLCNLNQKAVIAAKMHSKPMTGTSDTHMLAQLGYTCTLIDAEKNEESVIKALKAGRFKLVTKPLPVWLFAGVAVNSLYKIYSGQFRFVWRKITGKI